MARLPELKYLARKSVTFNNNAGMLPLFTVTGAVDVTLLANCTTDLVSAAGATLYIDSSAETELFGSKLAESITAGMWLEYTTPDWVAEPVNATLWGQMNRFLLNGLDLYAVADGQIDSGVIEFYVLWTPLSSDGLVEAA